MSENGPKTKYRHCLHEYKYLCFVVGLIRCYIIQVQYPPTLFAMSLESQKIPSQETTTELSNASMETPTQDESEFNQPSILVLAGAFCALFCSIGFVNAWGVFQEYYYTHQLSSKSEFDISWIGGFTSCIMYLSAGLVGPVYDKTGPQILLATGSVGVLFSTFMVSLCKEYYQIFLAQALLFGISSAFLTTPSLSTLTKYFQKNRGLAMGIVVSGSSAGGIVWPIVLDRFLNHTTLGFGWTIRILVFIMLPLLAVSCLLVRLPPKVISVSSNKSRPPAAKPKANFGILKNPAFILCCTGIGVAMLGMFAPFYYVSSYATYLDMSTSYSFYLVSIVNATSLFGRVLPGILADRYGCFNLLLSAMLVSGVVAFCWTAATSVAGVTVWALAYGFASGAILSLQTTCVSRLATPETMGTAMGMCMASVAVMTLCGAPVSGQLLGRYGYLAISMFSGATLVAGSALIACARFVQDRRLFAVV